MEGLILGIMIQCLGFLTPILPAYVAWVILMFC